MVDETVDKRQGVEIINIPYLARYLVAFYDMQGGLWVNSRPPKPTVDEIIVMK